MQGATFIKLPATIGDGMVEWDQKGRTSIRQILVSYSPTTSGVFSCCKIHGLQFQYLEKKGSEMSNVFGNMSGTCFKLINLDYPREYITTISIYNNGATGIAFTTNLGKIYGQFPESDLNPIHFDFGNGNQFGGLYGTADSSGICSLGVYLRVDNFQNTPLLKRAARRLIPRSKKTWLALLFFFLSFLALLIGSLIDQFSYLFRPGVCLFCM